MVKIIMNGALGKMGRVISEIVAERNDCEIVCGFDIEETMDLGYPVYKNPEDFSGEADVLIDFSHPSALSGILSFCRKRNIPAVICTTGLSNEQKNEMEAASEHVGMFFSANMSLGINLITELAKKAAAILEGSFDIEIVERHHNQKIDAPSGTALAIADAISESLTFEPEYTYDRHSVRAKRKPQEIGIHAVRGGTIVGDHTVIFAGKDEVIEISHSAASKEVFAVGAVKAALFMAEKGSGMYNMADIINV